MGVLDEVRAHAAAVAGSARFVSIDVERIAQYAASLPLDQARAAELDPATHYLGEPEATLAYVVTLDAINFGSGYFPHLRKRPGMSGYFTVATTPSAPLRKMLPAKPSTTATSTRPAVTSLPSMLPT